MPAKNWAIFRGILTCPMIKPNMPNNGSSWLMKKGLTPLGELPPPSAVTPVSVHMVQATAASGMVRYGRLPQLKL